MYISMIYEIWQEIYEIERRERLITRLYKAILITTIVTFILQLIILFR